MQPLQVGVAVPHMVPHPLSAPGSETKWDGWPNGIFECEFTFEEVSYLNKSIGQQGQMVGVVVMILPHPGQVGRGDISNVWGSLSATTQTAT